MNKSSILFLRIILFGCATMTACSPTNNTNNPHEKDMEISQPKDTVETPELNIKSTDQYNIFVAFAVDSWLFQHLLNFASYHRLIPIVEWLGKENGWKIYKYSVRYAATNAKGGTETNTLIFRVRLLFDYETGALKEYEVLNITPQSDLSSNGTLTTLELPPLNSKLEI